MSVEMREVRTGLAAASVLVAVLWGLAGCGGSGGSGSSGFDVSPVSESQAIARAIDGEQCVAFQQHTFCASGVEAVTGDFQGAAVIIETPETPLLCDGNASGEKCTASLAFSTEGFMTQNSLLAAVGATEHGPWTLAPLTVSEDVTGPRTVSIIVPGRTNARRPTPLIAAVLVYAGTPPETVPQTSTRLADFGADLVYVSTRLEIVVAQ